MQIGTSTRIHLHMCIYTQYACVLALVEKDFGTNNHKSWILYLNNLSWDSFPKNVYEGVCVCVCVCMWERDNKMPLSNLYLTILCNQHSSSTVTSPAGSSPPEMVDLQLDYWTIPTKLESVDKSERLIKKDSKTSLKTTFRSVQVYRLPPGQLTDLSSSTLSMMVVTKENKKKSELIVWLVGWLVLISGECQTIQGFIWHNAYSQSSVHYALYNECLILIVYLIFTICFCVSNANRQEGQGPGAKKSSYGRHQQVDMYIKNTDSSSYRLVHCASSQQQCMSLGSSVT